MLVKITQYSESSYKRGEPRRIDVLVSTGHVVAICREEGLRGPDNWIVSLSNGKHVTRVTDESAHGLIWAMEGWWPENPGDLENSFRCFHLPPSGEVES